VIEKAVANLTHRGWASFTGTLEQVTDYAKRAGWETVPLRRGDPAVSDLRPMSVAKARANSMSSRTGIGPQPLHTDGAHLKNPPHVIALESTRAQSAGTRLWSANCSDVPWGDLRHGIFRVSDGRSWWHALAADNGAIRFDPCCMIALDERARRAVRFFASIRKSGQRHEWRADAPEVLLIDNRRALHAREAVDPADPERHLRRIAFRRDVTT